MSCEVPNRTTATDTSVHWTKKSLLRGIQYGERACSPQTFLLAVFSYEVVCVVHVSCAYISHFSSPKGTSTAVFFHFLQICRIHNNSTSGRFTSDLFPVWLALLEQNISLNVFRPSRNTAVCASTRKRGYYNICPTITPIDVEIQSARKSRELYIGHVPAGADVVVSGSGEAGMNCSKMHRRCGVCIVCDIRASL